MVAKKSKEYVRDIMSRQVVTLDVNKPLIDAVKLMANRNISCLVIVKNKKAVGMITERDILRKVVALNKAPNNIPVKQVMSSPIKTIRSDITIVDAGKIMTENKIRRLPVEEDGRLIGLITETDISNSSLELVKHLYWKIVDMSLKTGKGKQ